MKKPWIPGLALAFGALQVLAALQDGDIGASASRWANGILERARRSIGVEPSLEILACLVALCFWFAGLFLLAWVSGLRSSRWVRRTLAARPTVIIVLLWPVLAYLWVKRRLAAGHGFHGTPASPARPRART